MAGKGKPLKGVGTAGPFDVRKLYDKKFKSINSNITFWDVYVALNAQYHDNIELYKE